MKEFANNEVLKLNDSKEENKQLQEKLKNSTDKIKKLKTNALSHKSPSKDSQNSIRVLEGKLKQKDNN